MLYFSIIDEFLFFYYHILGHCHLGLAFCFPGGHFELFKHFFVRKIKKSTIGSCDHLCVVKQKRVRLTQVRPAVTPELVCIEAQTVALELEWKLKTESGLVWVHSFLLASHDFHNEVCLYFSFSVQHCPLKTVTHNFVLLSKTAPPFVLETTSKVNLSITYSRAPTQGVTITSFTTWVRSCFTGVAVAQLVEQAVKWSKRWWFKSQLWLTQWMKRPLAAPCIAAAARQCMKGRMRPLRSALVYLEGALTAHIKTSSV